MNTPKKAPGHEAMTEGNKKTLLTESTSKVAKFIVFAQLLFILAVLAGLLLIAPLLLLAAGTLLYIDHRKPARYWIARSYPGPVRPEPYCVYADPDTGKLGIVSYYVATNGVNMNWHILPGTTTYNRQEAEKSLRKWMRSPRKLQRELERLIIF